MLKVSSWLTGLSLALAACGQVPSVSEAKSADSVASSPEQQHTVAKLNEYRAKVGAPPLTLDGALTDFAIEGNDELAAGGPPHGHFQNAGSSIFSRGFCSQAAENQAPGWTGGDTNEIVDQILQAMMDEGPGGGHHDNILNPGLTRVGVAIVIKGGRLYFTNDFSGPCD
jgi:uncharacterized protein YkwD